MGNGYSTTAYNYNKEDIGIDPETKTQFVPNEKELELFRKEKMTLYKGTWTVCFVYGISALILLVIVLFTDMGRNYIYDRYFPAVITYVIGAIIIIIYLVYSIFDIKPRKLGKIARKLNNCPDYWKYTKEDVGKTDNISELIRHGCNPIYKSTCGAIKKGISEQYILEKDDVTLDVNTSNLYIGYKCEVDKDVFQTNTDGQKKMMNEIYGDAFYKDKWEKQTLTGDGKYLTVDLTNSRGVSPELVKYAQIAGIYNKDVDEKLQATALFKNSISNQPTTYTDYTTSIPLICNEVYPHLLSNMEKNEVTTDLRCEYAKECNISWSDIDCYKNIVTDNK